MIAQIYKATFTIGYDEYMKALTQGKNPKQARLMPDRMFRFVKEFANANREKAVYKACQWYWDNYKGAWGQINDIMVVNDPCEEVKYGDDFACSSRSSRYLDEPTIRRLIEESDGELTREVKEGKKHHPKNPLKRVRRRRLKPKLVGTNLYQASSGAMYYVTTYRSKNGKRCRKENKLASRTIEKAEREIQRRFGIEPEHCKASKKKLAAKWDT